MSVQVSYMGSRILNLTSDGTKKLTTKGKVCTDDITVQNTQDGGIIPSGTIHIDANGTYDVTDKANAVVNVAEHHPDYQTVMYLEGHGTEWIDTEVMASLNTKIEIICSYNSNANGTLAVVGARTGATTTDNVGVIIGDTTGVLADFGDYAIHRVSYIEGHANVVYRVISSKDARIVYDMDGNLLAANTVINSTSFTAPHSILMFDIFNRSTASTPLMGKIYRCRIWDGAILIRDFVPSVRTADIKPGMYDLVGNQFYVNQGSGEFSVGSNFVTDEAVTVTQNGVTNVPTGKRYNPITVNVPVPTDTTATASDIAGGKTAYIGGSKVTGTAVIETNSRLYKVNIPSAITTGTVSIMTAVPEITAHFNDTALTVELLPKFSIASTDTAVYCFILAGNSYVMEAQYAVSVYKGESGAMSIVKSALPLNTSSAISSALKVTSGGDLQVRCGSNYQLFAGDYDIRISW